MMQNQRRHQETAGGMAESGIVVNGHGGRNGVVLARSVGIDRKQRVTITLPASLLERLRNAVYWTGHSTLACLIAEALEEAVTQIENTHGGPFPARLSPLKRGRPRLRPRRLTDTSAN